MSDQRDNNDGRRSADQALKILQDHIATDEKIQAEILVTLNEIKKDQAAMMEMLTTFNNIKGFAATMRSVAMLSTWVVVFAGSITAIGYAIKAWVKS